jgi:DNA polymerase-3 subunit alpha
MKMENDQFYVRSPDEMYLHFPGLEDAVARSQEIANSVLYRLGARKAQLPELHHSHNSRRRTSISDRLCESRFDGALRRGSGDALSMVNSTTNRQAAARSRAQW